MASIAQKKRRSKTKKIMSLSLLGDSRRLPQILNKRPCAYCYNAVVDLCLWSGCRGQKESRLTLPRSGYSSRSVKVTYKLAGTGTYLILLKICIFIYFIEKKLHLRGTVPIRYVPRSVVGPVKKKAPFPGCSVVAKMRQFL